MLKVVCLSNLKLLRPKGMTGSCLVKNCDFGSKTEFNMVVPQMPGGGIHMVNMTMSDHPDLIYSINDNSKSYTESKKTDVAQEDKREYTVKKIGEEKVNGYNCIHALVTEGAQTSDMWTTKDVPEYNKHAGAFASNKRMGSPKRDKALKDAGCDGLPVKIINKGNEREGDVTMELVKLEKTTYAKSDFEIPAGYTKSGTSTNNGTGIKTQQEIMAMTPEERSKYMEELKKQYGK